MFSFENDYAEGACPKVLNAIVQNNSGQLPGYGMDEISLTATALIKEKLGREDVDVHFVTGGTQCNILAISLLKPYEAVISAETGHINVHETGAVELSGHKIIPVATRDGKIRPEQIQQVLDVHTSEHLVKPKMVFIANATELGTVYDRFELRDLYLFCREHGLYLYVDGARIGNALSATDIDLSFTDLCNSCDMFYIGGTKNGALIGEAMVIVNDDLKPDFRYYLKQNGAMMAKGRFIAEQFKALMEDETYLENAKNANIMAQALKYILRQYGIVMYVDSPSNQIFPIIDNKLLSWISSSYKITEWGAYDDQHTIIRMVCSWATTKDDIQNFYVDLADYVEKNRS